MGAWVTGFSAGALGFFKMKFKLQTSAASVAEGCFNMGFRCCLSCSWKNLSKSVTSHVEPPHSCIRVSHISNTSARFLNHQPSTALPHCTREKKLA